MIPGLAHLIDCTTTGLISKITSYLGQKSKYIIYQEAPFNQLLCKGPYVILKGGSPIEKANNVSFIFDYLEPSVFTKE